MTLQPAASSIQGLNDYQNKIYKNGMLVCHNKVCYIGCWTHFSHPRRVAPWKVERGPRTLCWAQKTIFYLCIIINISAVVIYEVNRKNNLIDKIDKFFKKTYTLIGVSNALPLHRI